jgi:hypothetical protein
MTPAEVLEILFSDECPLVSSVQFMRRRQAVHEVQTVVFVVCDGMREPVPSYVQMFNFELIHMAKVPGDIVRFSYRAACQALRKAVHDGVKKPEGTE